MSCLRGHTAGFLRQGSGPPVSQHQIMSPMLILTIILFSLPLQPPHTSGKTLFHAFTLIPPTWRYLSGPEQLEAQHFSSLRLEVSYCRFLQKPNLQYISVALDSPNWADWLHQEQTCPLAIAVQLPLPEGLIVQPNLQTQMGWNFAKKPVFLPSASFSPWRET